MAIETTPTLTAIERMFTADRVVELAGLSREEWLEYRREGLGGSDASAVLNMNPYTSPFRLWHDKTGTPMGDSAGEGAYWGQVLEDIVATETGRRTGLVLYKPRYLYRSADWPFLQGNPDRLAWNPLTRSLGIMEAKTCGPHMAEEWDDGPSTHALLQSIHYMMVLGLRWAQISVLIAGQRFETFHVTMDDELAEMMLNAEAAFWQSVVERQEPTPTALDSDTDLLREMWPTDVEDKRVLLPEEATELVNERRTLVAQRDELDERCKEIENQFRRWLEDGAIGVDLDGRELATNKTISQRRVDTDRLKQELPEVAETYTRSSEYRRLWFPKPKKTRKDVIR